jgi:hypothetical protein
MTSCTWEVYLRLRSMRARHVTADDAEDPQMLDLMARVGDVRASLEEPYRAAVSFGDGWIAAQAYVEGGTADGAIAEVKYALWYAAQEHGLAPVLNVLEAHAEEWRDDPKES